jgi:protein-disulfide isomerase
MKLAAWASLALVATTSVFAASQPAADPKTTVAVIGSERVTLQQLEQRNKARLDEAESQYRQSQQQLAERFAHERHEALETSLENWLDQRAVELEAAERKLTRDQLLGEIRVGVVSDDEATKFYAENKQASDPPINQVLAQVKQYLANQRSEAATRAFYDGLRAKHGVRSQLEPYRLAVEANGAAHGPAAAPVTIVEFGDFQCPFCAQIQSVLKSVQQKYPNDVRVVFRHFPLEEIHPNARVSAMAGICSARQGKFWEMHDTMYGDQTALSMGGLLDSVRRLGLDSEQFKACMTDPVASALIDSDTKAGLALGVTGTPAFFINGRPLSGVQPEEKFDALIRDELARVRKKG